MKAEPAKKARQMLSKRSIAPRIALLDGILVWKNFAAYL
jgi:hypothetical protein